LIRPIHNEFGSPTLFVRKANGSLRLCVDYRGLDEVTSKHAYPLLRSDDTLDELKGANFNLRLASYKFECVIKTSTRLPSRHIMA
jgi:hypothetical protein